MKNYIDLVEKILRHGEERMDRTGVGTMSIFGGSIEWDLRDRFPLVTAKETRWRTAFLEMLFFLAGQTNVSWLNDRGSKLWDAWSDANGNLGPVYGFGWRRWGARPENIPQPKANLRDGLAPTFCGVANGSEGPGHPLFGTWTGMVQRCYDRNSIGYKNYGARGVHVCDDWLEFKAFARDASTLPGYENKIANPGLYQIDKDIMGTGFRYSRECCMWVTRTENIEANLEWRYTVEKGGRLFTFANTSQFCKENGISSSNFDDLWLKGGDITRYGFRLVSMERIRPEVDQVAQLIRGINENPFSRRHIVSAWNVGLLNDMALPPCHWSHQCYASKDGWLDMVVMQRSWDIALGAPFNISAYALLLHLYARATGRKPRRLVFNYGDAHIYLNHVDAMRKVVKDGPVWGDSAQLMIRTDNTDIDGYRLEDFDVVGYSPRPFVPLPVAV